MIYNKIQIPQDSTLINAAENFMMVSMGLLMLALCIIILKEVFKDY